MKPREPSGDAHRRPLFHPRIDAHETADAIVLTADMPGVDEHTVSVVFERGRLTLAGKAVSHDPQDLQLEAAEYEGGDYEVAFQLPEKIDADQIAGTIRHGVLRVTVPKLIPAAPRQIVVQAG